MKMNLCCVKTLWNKLCCTFNTMDRPIIRKRIDAEMGIYSDRKASKPVVGIDIDGEWTYKLSCVLKIMAAVLFMMWLWCRLSRWVHKIF